MSRLLLLANPSASGFTGALYRDVVSILSTAHEVDAEWPLDPGESRRLSAAAAENGYSIVVAMGGDGIVHHVANGVAGTSAALGIVPAGTTNVAARIYMLPKRPRRAAVLIARLPATPTRLARIESSFKGETSVEYATFAVGVGFDAAVVERAEQRPHSKVWFGGAHYAESAISTLLTDWRGRPANLRVDIDGERVDGVAALTQVHHPYTYFGRVPLHITQNHVEGLAAVVAGDLEVHRAAEIFARAILRKPLADRLDAPVFTCFDRLTIDAEPATAFQADGEHLGLADRIEITPATDALLVVRDPEACCTPRENPPATRASG
ncbi:MAG: diacylglycerol kinase family protein [Actinomycetota bacterium]